MPDPQKPTENNPGNVAPGASPAQQGASANAGAANNPAAPSTPDAKQGGSSTPNDDKGGQQTVPLAALHEEREKRQSLQAEIDQLKQIVSTIPQQQQQQQYQQPQQQQPIDQDPRKKEIEKLWNTDPRKAVQGEIGLALEWYDRVNAGLDFQADKLASKHPDFNNYRSQAMGYLRNMPLNQRSSPEALELAYFVVRGQNTDTLLKSREQELYQQFQQNPQQFQTPPGTTPQSQIPQSGGSQLTDQQRAVAAVMGMSEEDYAQHIQAPKGA